MYLQSYLYVFVFWSTSILFLLTRFY